MSLREFEFTSLEKSLVESYFQDKQIVYIVSFIISLVFLSILWNHVSHLWLLIWTILILIGNLFRLHYLKAFKKYKRLHSFSYWEKRYIYPTLFVGISWGSVSFFTINSVPVGKDLVILCFIVGVSMGAALGNIEHKKVAYIYTLAIIFPYVTKIIVEGRDYQGSLLLALFIFTFFIFRQVNKFHQERMKNFSLIEQRESLLKKIQGQFELEKQLNEERLKSVQNSKLISLGEITGGIAHEINNPLTIIMGRLFKLKKYVKNNEDQSKILSEINAISNVSLRIGNIIQIMRTLSRKDDQIKLEQLQLLDLLEKALSNNEEKLLEHPIKIIRDDFRDFSILGVQEHITQSLSNLISNAIDIHKGDKNAWIHIYTLKEQDRVKVFVMDSGSGISEEIQPKLFQPFFTTKDIGEGSGLGLSISQSLLQKIGGNLTYQTKDGHTCFIIELSYSQSNLD